MVERDRNQTFLELLVGLHACDHRQQVSEGDKEEEEEEKEEESRSNLRARLEP